MENKGEIELWDDNEILPGDEWYQDIADNLANSDILLYLVSAASLASKNCNKELAEALETNTRVIPIILEACDWENHQLSRFEVLPSKGEVINTWEPKSNGWQNVVEGIRKVVDKMPTQTTGSAQKGTLPEWVFQQGNFLMMLGQIDKAIEAYSYAIGLNPDDVNTYNNRGMAYYSKEEHACAIEDFTKATKIKPNHVDAYYNRGNAHVLRGEAERAILDYNKAIEIKHDYANAYSNRGVAYYSIEKYGHAMEDFIRAIELKPNDPEAYFNRGAAFSDRGHHDRAILDYSMAIKLKPDHVNAYNNRGVAYGNRGDYDRAIEDYGRAIELKPDAADAYNNRGVAYGKKGEFEGLPRLASAVVRAIKDYNSAIGLNPEFAPAYYNRGEAWLRLREWEKAKSDLTVARDKGMDIITAFRTDYESIADFERRNGVNLPEDIAEMLTLPQA